MFVSSSDLYRQDEAQPVFVTQDGIGTRHRTYASGVLETCAPIGFRSVEPPARK
jgi:hypothetical protein